MARRSSTPADDMADALCDLNMAHAILCLCDSSLFRTAAGKRFEERIIKLCKEHAQLQLRAYDRNRSCLTP